MLHLAVFVAMALQAAPVEGGVQAGADPAARAELRATRLATPPVIDGRDDDPVWSTVPRVTDLWQFEPDNEAQPTFPTEFRIGYDTRNLYLVVRAHDPHPDSIATALARRDANAPSDRIYIAVDSYNDRRTGFEFGINAAGVRYDSSIYGDDRRDSSWDGVWYAESRVDEQGWVAEFRIPLSQLRYPDVADHAFGLTIRRRIERFAEVSTWPHMDRNAPGFVSKFGQLTGLEGLDSSRGMEFTPYTVAKTHRSPVESAGFRNDPSLDAGADLKVRLTPNVTLNATVNPDFGQVEADPADLNLTAFETFFRERRPFFLEGTGVYDFRINCYIVVDCNSNESLFYSRRIGRSPSLADRYGDRDTPGFTPITAATKLTGRTPGGFSFGVLDAFNRQVEGSGDRTVEPASNFAVASAEQSFRDGDAGIQLTATSVNRAMDAWSSPYLHRAAYAGGLTGRTRLLGGNYELSGMLAASRVEGTAEAIALTQTNAVHRYQQPGDDLEFDPTRTSLNGSSAQIKFGKYGGGITRFETTVVRHSAGFDINDLGYLRRSDYQNWSTWGALTFNNPTPLYRWLQVNGNHWQEWTTSGERTDFAFNGNAHMGFQNNWNVHGGATFRRILPSICDRCTRGGPRLAQSGGVYPWFGVNGDNRRMLVPSFWVNLGYGDEGESRSVRLGPELTVRFSTNAELDLGLSLNHNEDNTQWIGNFGDANGATHYTFAHLDQRTLSMTLRMNYAVTPDLTFEFYGEPFVSTGEYTDFREVSATPEASRYGDRFLAYDPPPTVAPGFTFRHLKTNSVLRWEYLPGSTLFLVWAHGREGSTGTPNHDPWADQYRDLFDVRPEHTLLVKLAYWFSR